MKKTALNLGWTRALGSGWRKDPAVPVDLPDDYISILPSTEKRWIFLRILTGLFFCIWMEYMKRLRSMPAATWFFIIPMDIHLHWLN